MSDASEILVIILSVFLALFLLLATILIILLIRITRQIKTVTTVAQSTAEHIESVVMNVSKVTSPMLIAKFLTKQFKRATKGDK